MRIFDLFDSVYCVNLDKRPDRMELAEKEFAKVNIKPERFSAVYDPVPWKGCRLSHIAILEKAAHENKSVLIFEDDAEFINYDESLLSESYKEVMNLDKWDMLYLGGNILQPFYKVDWHLAKLSHCQSTHAYGVNKHFVKPLASFIKANEHIIDVLYANAVVPYNKCYITVPMMAIQRTSYSDIEKQDMTYDIPIARYNHFLVKGDFVEK